MKRTLISRSDFLKKLAELEQTDWLMNCSEYHPFYIIVEDRNYLDSFDISDILVEFEIDHYRFIGQYHDNQLNSVEVFGIMTDAEQAMMIKMVI